MSLTDRQKVCLDHWIETNELDERAQRAQKADFVEYSIYFDLDKIE